MQIINAEVSQSLGFIQTQVLSTFSLISHRILQDNLLTSSSLQDNLLTIISGFCLQVNTLPAI